MEFISVQICLAETDSKLLINHTFTVLIGESSHFPFSIFEALNGIWIFNSC